MSGRPPTIFGEFQQSASAIVRGRLANPQTSEFAEGIPWVAADVLNLTATVYSNGVIVDAWNAIPVEPSIVIYPSLSGWGRDSGGWNFLHTLGPEAFPLGGVVARVLYVANMADGTVQWWDAVGTVKRRQ